MVCRVLDLARISFLMDYLSLYCAHDRSYGASYGKQVDDRKCHWFNPMPQCTALVCTVSTNPFHCSLLPMSSYLEQLFGVVPSFDFPFILAAKFT